MDLLSYKSNLKNMNYGQIVSILVDDVNRGHLSPYYRKAILDQLTAMNNELFPPENSNIISKVDNVFPKNSNIDETIIDDIVNNLTSEDDEDNARDRVLKRMKKSAKILNKLSKKEINK